MGTVRAEQAGGVRLLSTSDASFRFEIRVPTARLIGPAPGAPGAQGSLLDIPGWPGGDPLLGGVPAHVVTAAVPPTGAVRIEAVGDEPEVVEGTRLVRFGTAAPGVRARLIDVGWMRNQRVARIAVLPVDYDRAAGRLTIHHRIEVSVFVEPPGALGIPAEEPDPMEGVYRSSLVNYEQGRGWRRPALARAAGRATLLRPSASLLGLAAAVPETSVYVGRNWIKIAIPRAGFYKVDFGRLRAFTSMFPDSGVALDSLRLFNWPGVPVLPTASYCDTCDLREVAIGIQDDGDGRFSHNSDEFYFYAMGPSDWASLYDASQPESLYVNHPYETNNYYYLTVATRSRPVGGTPVRITTVSGSISHPEWPTPATFPARAHLEQDNQGQFYPNATPLLAPYGSEGHRLAWEKWFWQSAEGGGTIKVTADLPGADTTQAARLRAVIWGLTYSTELGGLLPDHEADLWFNNVAFARRGWDLMAPQIYDTTCTCLRESGNELGLAIPDLVDPRNSSRRDRTGLAWFEVYYRRAFRPVGDRLDFDTPDGGNGGVVYRVGPFAGAQPRVFDVTDPGRPFEIQDLGAQYVPQPDGSYLSFQAAETSRRRYRIVPDDSLVALTPENLAMAPSTSLENLRSPSERADYLVIYYDGFKAAADSLLAWRRTHLPLVGVDAPYEVKGVPVSAVYDQFSGGRTDPGALRNFLRAVFYVWNDYGVPRRTTFVTLLGDASPDYKNIAGNAKPGQPGCLLPTWEDNFDSNWLSMGQYTTDDWLLNVDDPVGGIPDFFGGRLPVESPEGALAVVTTKVLQHERRSPLGEWRNNIMLIADDNIIESNQEDPLGWWHVRQTADLDEHYTPLHLDRDYVYLNEYPTQNSTKPGAKQAIRTGFENGTAVVNFIGHGSKVQLTAENVLLYSDVGSLTNAPRFPVFVSASCDVGRFSDAGRTNLGEGLLSSPNGGCIGVISATGESYSWDNDTLNVHLYQQMFRRDTVDCAYHVTMAEALMASKAGTLNDSKYQLLGDAGSQPALPRLWVDLSVADSGGTAAAGPIRRGRTYSVTGRVLTCPGGTQVPLDGSAALLVEDSQEFKTAQTAVSDAQVSYYYNRAPIFHGNVKIAGGVLQGRFIVPLEAREGDRARVRAYVEGQAVGEAFRTDGTGSIPVTVDTAEAVPTDDQAGPRISLSFVGGSTEVRPDAVLQVDLYDPSGILTTDHTPQNGIVVTVDGNLNARSDITGTFRYAADSYQSGTARFQLPKLAVGAHTITVSAADNLAQGLTAAVHRSKASLDFTVVDQPDLRIAHAYLFPNPTESAWGRGGGQFVVDTPGDSINVLLRIYTVSGRLIRTLKVFGGLGQVQVPWDGLDDEGHPLANGVYLFRVHVNPRDPDGTSSALKKADADGRFVIVNRR